MNKKQPLHWKKEGNLQAGGCAAPNEFFQGPHARMTGTGPSLSLRYSAGTRPGCAV